MTDTSPTRIVLADDDALVRRGVRLTLDAEPDLTVVAEAELPGDADSRPDHVRQRAVLLRVPRCRCLGLRPEVRRGPRSGRGVPGHHAGRAVPVPRWVDALVRDCLERARDGRALPSRPITDREEEILKLVAEGHTSQ